MQCNFVTAKKSSYIFRFAVRVLRALQATRKKLSLTVIEKIINGFYTHSKEAREALLSFLPAAEEEKMEVSNSMFKSSTDQVIVFPSKFSWRNSQILLGLRPEIQGQFLACLLSTSHLILRWKEKLQSPRRQSGCGEPSLPTPHFCQRLTPTCTSWSCST